MQSQDALMLTSLDQGAKFLHFKSELEKLKGKQRTEFYNKIVYSGFSYPRGAQSFKKEERFGNNKSPSPGPACYNVDINSIEYVT
jgi:hypothetical protein